MQIMQSNPDALYAGIDVGGTTIGLVLIDREGRVASRRETDTLAAEGCEAVLGRIRSTISDMVSEVGIGRMVGVGVALPGVLDMDSGVSLFLPNMPGNWPGVPVASILSGSLGVPAFLLNDARVATFGESEFGAGRNAREPRIAHTGHWDRRRDCNRQ